MVYKMQKCNCICKRHTVFHEIFQLYTLEMSYVVHLMPCERVPRLTEPQMSIYRIFCHTVSGPFPAAHHHK